MCTLEGSALTKKSSIMVCDNFRVNILLVSPDKSWIAAGTTDNSDFCPKVLLVVFDSTVFFTSSFMLFGNYFISTRDNRR